MTTISPTRVSLYDLLYQDTYPMISLLADLAQVSLPQAKIALADSLQAIISALLAYDQRLDGQTLQKKLLSRPAIKELRGYNAMNFATIEATRYYRRDVAEALFGSPETIAKACDHIADHIGATRAQVEPLLTTVCVIALREIAIFVDYCDLDGKAFDQWLALQPQFLSPERFLHPPIAIASASANPAANKDINAQAAKDTIYLTQALLEKTPPEFDPFWHTLSGFDPAPSTILDEMKNASPRYIEAIKGADDTLDERFDEVLAFADMPAIHVPYQRWLLQLARVTEVYLTRARLRIAPEPKAPPSRPLISLATLDEVKKQVDKIQEDSDDKDTPLWKHPVVLLVIVVIGTLGVLAYIKYEMQRSNGVVPATEAVLEQEKAQSRLQNDIDNDAATADANMTGDGHNNNTL